MSLDVPLTPLPGAGQSISATTTSASVTLNAVGAAATRVEIVNSGTTPVAVRIGAGAQTAVAADYVILGGQSRIISKAPGNDTVAAIMLSGTATIYVSPLQGGI